MSYGYFLSKLDRNWEKLLCADKVIKFKKNVYYSAEILSLETYKSLHNRINILMLREIGIDRVTRFENRAGFLRTLMADSLRQLNRYRPRVERGVEGTTISVPIWGINWRRQKRTREIPGSNNWLASALECMRPICQKTFRQIYCDGEIFVHYSWDAWNIRNKILQSI